METPYGEIPEKLVKDMTVQDARLPEGAVRPPRFPGGETSVLVRAIDPTQNSGGITSIASPAVMDSVTLVRRSGFSASSRVTDAGMQGPARRESSAVSQTVSAQQARHSRW